MYEYKTETFESHSEIESRLNALGQRGWRLVSMVPSFHNPMAHGKVTILGVLERVKVQEDSAVRSLKNKLGIE